MPRAELAAGHYEPDGQGDNRKICKNLYAEPFPADPGNPYRLVPTPGSRTIGASTVAGTLRGLAQADGHAGGKLLIFDDNTVRTMTVDGTETFGTLSGTLAGTDRVQSAFSEVEGIFLANGALHVSDGSTVAAVTDANFATLLSDHSQTAFGSVTSMGQRAIFSYGSRFGYSATLDFDNTTTLSWYTAESAPDGVVGVYAIGSDLYVCGTQTIELWYQTGTGDDPFARQSSVIQRGIVGRDAVAELDNTLLFVADDRTVRRLDGLVPTILNADDPWVTRHLQSTAAEDIICEPMEVDGHSFLFIRTPTLCIVYDVMTSQFHIRETYNSTTWQWLFHKRVGAVHYAASSTGLAELSRAYKSDNQVDADTFGTEIPRSATAHLTVRGGRGPMSHIRLEGTKGVGLTAGQGDDPMIALAISKNRGQTFGEPRWRCIGKIGEYDCRTVWHRNGRASPPQIVFKFDWTDPVGFAPTEVLVNDGG